MAPPPPTPPERSATSPPSGTDPIAARARPEYARLHIWQIQALRDALWVAALIFIVYAGYAMRSVTVPLLVALALAYFIEPLVSSLTRRYNVSRSVVVGGLLCTAGVLVLAVLAITIPIVVNQTIELVRDVRAGKLSRTAENFRQYVPAEYREQYDKALQWLSPADQFARMNQFPYADNPAAEGAETQPTETAPDGEAAMDEPSPAPHPVVSFVDDEHIRQIVREELALSRAAGADGHQQPTTWLDTARGAVDATINILGSIVAFGLLAFLIPFYLFFFSISFPSFVRFMRSLIPPTNRVRTLELLGKMDRAIAGFVRGRIVISVITGLLFAVGWWMCGVPYSFPIGLLTGIFFLVPYLAGVGVPLAIGALAMQNLGLPEVQRMSWWAVILWPSVVYALVQVIETYILTPIIAGRATNLDPVTIVVAVIAGGSVGGVYGMLLAIPVAACLKILWTEILLPKIRAFARGEADDPLPIRQ